MKLPTIKPLHTYTQSMTNVAFSSVYVCVAKNHFQKTFFIEMN